MKNSTKTFYSLLFFVVITTVGHTQTDITIDSKAPLTQKWAALKTVLAKKKMVALGENYHGVKEYNAIKLELVQYLHEEMGFNVLALEGDLAMTYFANAYRDSLTDTLILEKAVTPVWHTQHHLEMMAYVQAHPKLQLIGFDRIEGPYVSSFSTALGVAIDSTKAEFQALLKAYPQWEQVNGNTILYSAAKRDSVIADILIWIADQQYPGEKVIVSAHNLHICNDMPKGETSMGQLLKKRYKKHYYSIGFYHSLGKAVHAYRNYFYEYLAKELPKSSLQYQFLQKKGDLLFIPISQQKKKQAENKWLHQETQDFYPPKTLRGPIVLSELFDGLIWVRTISKPDYVIPSEYHDRYFWKN